jgi:hypothetical protein
MADPKLFKSTAIIVTMDEGGGYYDSGYVQPIDCFGDGTRIPTLVVSPYTKPGTVDHTYYDHASVLKFIERNWFLSPLSLRSRDNLPIRALAVRGCRGCGERWRSSAARSPLHAFPASSPWSPAGRRPP